MAVPSGRMGRVIGIGMGMVIGMVMVGGFGTR